MKIFNKEKEREVVYVQFEDLYFLETIGKLPDGIKCEIDDEEVVTAVDEEGEEVHYVKFTSYLTVQYFKAMHMVVDYKKERIKSLEELEKDGEELNKLLDICRKRIVDVNLDEFQKKETLKKMSILSYFAQGLEELYLAKRTGEVLTLPTVLDSDGFFEDLGEYEVRETIDGQKLFVMRKDGEKIEDDTVISLDIIEDIVKKDILSKGEKVPDSKHIYYSYIGLNEESTALVIMYTVYKPLERKSKENLFKRLIKKFM